MKISSWVFVVFYVLAALLQPGGFNPFVNFFCDLFQNPINGRLTFELSEIFGIISLAAISFVVGLFFFKYAQYSNWSNRLKLFVKISGILSATIMLFIFSPLHDELIILTSVIGAPALGIIFVDVLKQKHRNKSILGFITVLALIIYNAIFYLGLFEFTWPLFQKVCIILSLILTNQLYQKISLG